MSERQPKVRRTRASSVTAEVAFGLVLRELRLAADLTQADLEAMSNVDRSYISQVENGQKQVCFRTIIQLATKLGVTPGALVDLAVARMDRRELKKL